MDSNGEIHNISKRFTRNIFGVQALTFFLLIAIMLFSSNLHKRDLADQVARTLEGKIKRGDSREVINILSGAVNHDFAAIELLDRNNNHEMTLPTRYRHDISIPLSLYRSLVYTSYSRKIYYDKENNKVAATVVFTFTIFQLLPLALIIFIIGVFLSYPFIKKHRKLMLASFEKDSIEKQNEIITDLARQVRHDYRSPLTAIKSVIDKSQGLQENEKKVLSVAYNSMISMLGDLSKDNIETIIKNGHIKKKAKSLTHIYSAVSDIVDEKLARLDYGTNIDIQVICNDDDKRAYILIDEIELQRVLSNIIENALDALDGTGFIRVIVEAPTPELLITVEDNGKGISPQYIDRVKEKGFSIGKNHGEGLGLYSSIQKVKSWEGELKLDSKEGIGTSIAIKLNGSVKPKWSSSFIDFKDCKELVVLDDEKAIHELWKEKAPQHIKLTCFEKADQLLQELDKVDHTALFILDYNLKGQALNGLDVAEKLDQKEKCYLVSGSFHEPIVQRRCKSLGVQLIPKNII